MRQHCQVRGKKQEASCSTPDVCLRVRDVARMLGVSVATVWRWSRNRADFPRPRKLGERTTVWSMSELDAWARNQPDPYR